MWSFVLWDGHSSSIFNTHQRSTNLALDALATVDVIENFLSHSIIHSIVVIPVLVHSMLFIGVHFMKLRRPFGALFLDLQSLRVFFLKRSFPLWRMPLVFFVLSQENNDA